MQRFTAIALTCLGLSFGAAASAAFSAAAAPGGISLASSQLLAKDATTRFLNEYPDATVWNTPLRRDALVAALSGVAEHGLNPKHYHIDPLKDGELTPAEWDKLATDAWFSAAAHIVYGKLDPVSVEPDWTAAQRKADLAAALLVAISTDQVAESLEALAPKQAGYAALRAEYARLRELATTEMVIVMPGPALKANQSGARVTALQARLVQLELLSGDYAAGTMDAPTLQALKAFQISADLDDDGVAGTATLAALNRGVDQKLDQVRVNLERWRWLPDDLGRRHLRANIADFSVTAFKDGVAERTHLTIVGKTYRKTPVFSDEIETIVYNPWWETPASLARTDELRLFRKNAGDVNRLGFDIHDRVTGAKVDASTIDWNTVEATNFPYRLRQRPGALNALGQIKILFPNPHNVYIHDTPSRGLFAQRQRAFSSGCMRTQDPISLSEWLLQETDGWPRTRIDAAVASGAETRVNLASTVPVHVLYSTIVSEESGAVRYLDDIYGRDAAVLTGLRAAPR